jgi:putative endonuclease
VDKQYFVYIVASRTRRTYIGITSNLEQRLWQHRHRVADGHSKRYHKDRLVWFEEFPMVDDAIAREKQLKRWSAAKKVTLIERENPDWVDLAADWFGEIEEPGP